MWVAKCEGCMVQFGGHIGNYCQESSRVNTSLTPILAGKEGYFFISIKLEGSTNEEELMNINTL